jgi:cysteinyl-tRNA synthetase
MRPVVVFDVLNRLLQLDGEVDFTHNITDIDDKIIKKSIETGKTEKEISEKFTNEYLKNLKDINVLIPNNMPKVTDNVAPMVAFIQDLVEKGFAYEANGSVYFEIEKLNSYGEIANLKLEELKSEESFSQDKRSQLDFAL